MHSERLSQFEEERSELGHSGNSNHNDQIEKLQDNHAKDIAR